MSGWIYRVASRAMHRFDLHHTKRIGPLEDGRTLHRCEWCGVSRIETPLEVTIRDMDEIKFREATRDHS